MRREDYKSEHMKLRASTTLPVKYQRNKVNALAAGRACRHRPKNSIIPKSLYNDDQPLLPRREATKKGG